MTLTITGTTMTSDHTGPDAIARATQPPGHDHAAGQPDREAAD